MNTIKQQRIPAIVVNSLKETPFSNLFKSREHQEYAQWEKSEHQIQNKENNVSGKRY